MTLKPERDTEETWRKQAVIGNSGLAYLVEQQAQQVAALKAALRSRLKVCAEPSTEDSRIPCGAPATIKVFAPWAIYYACKDHERARRNPICSVEKWTGDDDALEALAAILPTACLPARQGQAGSGKETT